MKTPENRSELPPELDELLDKESREEAARLQEVWDLADAPERPGFPSEQALSDVFARLEEHIDTDEVAPQRAKFEMIGQPNAARVVPIRWGAIAASILLAAIGLGYWLSPVVTTAPLGEIVSVQLEDGTHVSLNSGATLRYARSFGNVRNVHLDGEAFFDVAKEARPFVVNTYNANVTVLGTSFNVRAWRSDVGLETKVALMTGSVRLEGTNSDSETVMLEPGQSARVSDAGVINTEIDTVQVRRASAWREGDFFFSNEWVGSIVDDIARRFDTSIQFETEMIRRRRMKLNLEKPQTAESALTEICASLSLRYREVAGGYEIFDPR